MTLNRRLVRDIITYALGILSVAAGIPKILQMPQELNFLSSIGLSGIAVSILGAAQTVGGALLFWSRSRLVGALLAALALLISTAAIFLAGNLAFALVSLVPFLVVLLVIWLELRGSGAHPD